jgi:hypothetical protein
MQTELFEIPQVPGRNTTNFVDNMSMPVHRWFRYSAGFSADWVQSVIADTARDNTTRVLDPFAGSATTLLAAQSSHVQSMGLDSHPFVARIARAKLNWTADCQLFRSRGKQLLADFAPRPLPEKLPALLSKCYTPDTLADLLSLRDQIARSRQGDSVDEMVWLAFVAIIRRVSYVGTAQWQYVLPNKRKRSVAGVKEAFRQQVELMASDMEWRQATCPSPCLTDYRETDARAVDSYPTDWATHVICSPPYANNYDYADATRLEQTVLGEVTGWGDLRETRRGLVRSCSQHMVRYDPAEALDDPILEPILDELRAVYEELSVVRDSHGGKKAYHYMVLAYFHDLASVWAGLRRATTSNARVCFVVGDSAPYGVHVPVERWLGQLATAAGFSSWHFEKVRDRNIKWENRKHRVPLHEGRLWIDG